jgi:hypothetical protein
VDILPINHYYYYYYYYYSASIFTEKAKHRIDNLRNTWHHVRNTGFSNVDACADVFLRCLATRFDCSRNLPSTRSWSFFVRSPEKKWGTWKRKFPQCLQRPVPALYMYLLCDDTLEHSSNFNYLNNYSLITLTTFYTTDLTMWLKLLLFNYKIMIKKVIKTFIQPAPGLIGHL